MAPSTLKSISRPSLFKYIYTGHGYFIHTTHINLIHKVWVNLMNERQKETRDLLGKKSKFHGINLLRRQWVHLKNYNYLNPTQILDLCCSFVQFFPLDCGTVVVVQHGQNFWVITEFNRKKRLSRSVRWHSIYLDKEVIQRCV